MVATPRATLSNLALPIIQAPMAGVSTPRLAAAVSNAGGLGSLGLGACTAAQARAMIEETQALTDKPFNVNVFCHTTGKRDTARDTAWLRHLAPFFAEFGAQPPQALTEIYQSFLADDALFHTLLALRPAYVSFHFGLPHAHHLSALRQLGITTMATATNPQEAALVEAAGVDAIIAQGIEAGGHRGMFDPNAVDEQLSTAVLLRLLRRQTALPLVAAGGIMDGYAIKAALDLGATAAQLGTAFILCPESAASAAYRTSLKSKRASATRLTSVLSGRPARGLVNRFILQSEGAGQPKAADYPFAYDAAKQLNTLATRQGCAEFSAHWAGQGAPLARELPATRLMQVLAEELQKATTREHRANSRTPLKENANVQSHSG